MVITWNELRDARERIGLTQEQLAEKLGVSTRTITNWENAGVAKKAEYKVERFFGDDLKRDESVNRIEAQLDYNKTIASMSLDERAEHEGLSTFAQVLKEASDAELLEELTRRARARGLIAVSKQIDLPRTTQREATLLLRGERSRLTLSDTQPSKRSDVGGSSEDTETRRQDEHALAAKKRSKNRGEVDY